MALWLVTACDSGGNKPDAKPAAPVKTAKAKTGKPDAKTPAKAVAPKPKIEPTTAAPTPEPNGDSPTPTPTPRPSDPAAAEAPTAVAEPTAADSTADPVAEPTADPAADPTADPTADPAADPAAAPAAGTPATGTGAEMTTPVSLGTDAEILRLVLAHDVVKRQPVDPSTTFPEGQKVSLFIESRNESGEKINVRVAWENVANGRRSPPVNVVIGTRKLHRTRAYRTMRKAGEYRAIVLGEDDTELAVMPFTVE